MESHPQETLFSRDFLAGVNTRQIMGLLILYLLDLQLALIRLRHEKSVVNLPTIKVKLVPTKTLKKGMSQFSHGQISCTIVLVQEGSNDVPMK